MTKTIELRRRLFALVQKYNKAPSAKQAKIERLERKYSNAVNSQERVRQSLMQAKKKFGEDDPRTKKLENLLAQTGPRLDRALYRLNSARPQDADRPKPARKRPTRRDTPLRPWD